jgi:hypothetical protein
MSCLTIVLGCVFRLWLKAHQEVWPDLPHFSSPYSDYARFLEAQAYTEAGLSPYFPESPVHCPPLVVQLLALLSKVNLSFVFFLLCDLVSAYGVRRIVKGEWAWSVYWLNPVTALNCAMGNTSAIVHALVLSFYTCTLSHNLAGGLSLGTLIYIDPSYAPLGFAWLFVVKDSRVLLTCTPTAVLLYGLSYLSVSSWAFIENCQLGVLLNTDICTNIGLSWYLLLEMFQKYQWLYRVLLAVHPWFYVYPLLRILRRYSAVFDSGDSGVSLYLALSLTISVALHSHPLLADLVVAMTLLLSHGEVLAKTKSVSVTLNGMWIGLLWSYWMWVLWARRLSGNANFFYFQTIVYNVMLLGLVVGMLYTVVKETNSRRHYLICRELVTDLAAKLDA